LLLFSKKLFAQAEQLMVACHPARTVVPFVTNLKVRHPVEEVITPGDVLPENEPMSGDVTEGPSYIVRMSLPPCVLNDANVILRHPEVEQNVSVMFKLFV
jgi:hypothetical protein